MAEMDVDDYYEGTQSNAPNTQASDQCIKKVIRLAIFTEQKRTPLSRQDITKKCNIPPKHFNAIMEKVNQKLKSDFAMEMCQLSVRAPRKQVLNMEVINAEDKKSNQWILR